MARGVTAQRGSRATVVVLGLLLVLAFSVVRCVWSFITGFVVTKNSLVTLQADYKFLRPVVV